MGFDVGQMQPRIRDDGVEALHQLSLGDWGQFRQRRAQQACVEALVETGTGVGVAA